MLFTETYRIEVSRYIEDIVDIAQISIYWYRIDTLDVSFSIYQYHISDK